MSNKTRFTSAERRALVMRGYVKPSQSVAVVALTTDAELELRKIGKRACSRIDAIMSRRRELGMVK